MTCKQSAKELTGNECTLGGMIEISFEDFCTWETTDTTGYDGHPYLDKDRCVNFKRELWFELGRCIWRKTPEDWIGETLFQEEG